MPAFNCCSIWSSRVNKVRLKTSELRRSMAGSMDLAVITTLSDNDSICSNWTSSVKATSLTSRRLLIGTNPPAVAVKLYAPGGTSAKTNRPDMSERASKAPLSEGGVRRIEAMAMVVPWGSVTRPDTAEFAKETPGNRQHQGQACKGRFHGASVGLNCQDRMVPGKSSTNIQFVLRTRGPIGCS